MNMLMEKAIMVQSKERIYKREKRLILVSLQEEEPAALNTVMVANNQTRQVQVDMLKNCCGEGERKST